MTERLRGRAGQRQRMSDLKRLGVTCSRCGGIGAWRRSEASANLPLLIVDHVVPLIKGGTDTIGNKRLLCEEPCHLEVTAEQFGHQRRVSIGACDVTGMPTDPAHPWNRTADPA